MFCDFYQIPLWTLPNWVCEFYKVVLWLLPNTFVGLSFTKLDFWILQNSFVILTNAIFPKILTPIVFRHYFHDHWEFWGQIFTAVPTTLIYTLSGFFLSCFLTVQTLFSYLIVCGRNFMTEIYSNKTSTEGYQNKMWRNMTMEF